jgi:hypothetical protein
MSTWDALQSGAADIEAAGRRLLVGDGTTSAYLATVRADGGPRVHPVMPVLAEGSLYVFVVNLSWKYRDLLRDGRYALHSSPSREAGEEFYVTGPAFARPDAALRERVRAACGNMLGGHEFEALFELGVERALWTKWEGWGTAQTWPSYRKWAAG